MRVIFRERVRIPICFDTIRVGQGFVRKDDGRALIKVTTFAGGIVNALDPTNGVLEYVDPRTVGYAINNVEVIFTE